MTLIEQLVAAIRPLVLARLSAPRRRHVRSPRVRVVRDWPGRFRNREAWLAWCARDAESERREMAMDDVLHFIGHDTDHSLVRANFAASATQEAA